MIDEFLNEQTIRLKQPAKDREEAIRLAAQPLVDEGKISGHYVQEMIDALHSMGPYMVIVPGIAFVHAKPGPSVYEDCLSLITLAKPVVFGHAKNDPVHTVFVLGSPEKGAHLAVLTHVSKLLVKPEFLQALASATQPQDVMKFFAGINDNKKKENE